MIPLGELHWKVGAWCLVCLLLFVSCAYAPPPPQSATGREFIPRFSEPAIEISLPDAMGAFHFAFCGRSEVRPEIYRVEVAPPGRRVGDLEQQSTFCSWRKRGGAPLTNEWRYGSSAMGSIAGACLPFAAGQAYEVVVEGSGAGAMEFEVEADGQLRITKSSCPGHHD